MMCERQFKGLERSRERVERVNLAHGRFERVTEARKR